MAETVDQPTSRPTNKLMVATGATLVTNMVVRAIDRYGLTEWFGDDLDLLRQFLGLAFSALIGAGIAYRWTKDRPNVDVPHGGGVQSHWLAGLCAAGLAALMLGGLAGCTTNRVTGEREVDVVKVFNLLALSGALLQIAADGEDPPPDVIDFAGNSIEEGITKFCLLDPWDKQTVRRQLDARDPAIRPYLIARYGGADGDVCSEA